MFDPNLNPYVAQIQDHKDIIWTAPIDDNPDRRKFETSQRPIIVDLGCGAGNFLRDYALSAPECDFIGFELRFKRLVKGAIKFKKHNVKNVRLVQARAEDIACWFRPDSLKEIYINFPDPWPKKRHRKHRLLTLPYLATLNKLLIKNGHFIFKTDHSEYFFPVLDLIKQQSLFEIIEYSEDLHNSSYNDRNIPSEFEMLFKNKGYPVYYVKTLAR
ncbi:MAG: tRNA (guanosine(46)-N7)-methyltransferase TrmB [Proteobacteria bacterium]|nr:tRNA (guanosine(46)-N7)-methyltransferase TrmB [Pseudomonadota bacterium]